MTQWKQKLEALLEGLHIIDIEKFINEGEVGDYRALGEIIYDNGRHNHERIDELVAEHNRIAMENSHMREYADNLASQLLAEKEKNC